ncbi:MAG: hypothetical protein NC408_07145 [Candidatus Gastranaerophilales bacterium]|nr:hypothetical protein [Candidatus Gastranaerophilales bacterium]
MRIQPITTDNNLCNANFQKLKIHNPSEWDADVLEVVVNSQSIKDFAKYLAERGQDLTICNYIKPIPMVMVQMKDEWHKLVGDCTKQAVIDGLANFNYKNFLAKIDVENQAMLENQAKCDKLLAQVDEFNKQLKSPNPETNEQPKKRTFFERLFGLNK